jgi:hypothetical protein
VHNPMSARAGASSQDQEVEKARQAERIPLQLRPLAVPPASEKEKLLLEHCGVSEFVERIGICSGRAAGCRGCVVVGKVPMPDGLGSRMDASHAAVVRCHNFRYITTEASNAKRCNVQILRRSCKRWIAPGARVIVAERMVPRR